ncbi:MAG TPA: type IV pili methyl-accepting chemotaxis transducer N-terminal domain-containing protein, partial [Pseudomonadales bacterium]|nr:type IV pili methyl-accepting chemotaxis transducer N-terminal domain-containing protein [Pseudomonadales bacterium]
MSSQSGQGTSAKSRGGLAVLLGAIAGVAALFAGYFFNEAAQSGDKVAKYISHASELRVLSQRIAKNAVEAAAGNEEAFAGLDKAKHDFQVRWDKIRNGNADEG